MDGTGGNGMERTRRFVAGLGLPTGDAHAPPSSAARFPDGGQYRIEIPSVEGPAALRAVYEAADAYGVPVHRVSQGSGVLLLLDAELDEMAALGRERGIEISLFVGPRAGWDTGAMAYSAAGRVVAPKARGMDQLVQAVEEVRRACDHGIESVLITDEGLLSVLGEMRTAGELPTGLILKGSVMLAAANPVSIRLLERLGLTTYNVPTDLSLAQLAAIRQATSLPLDVYVEVPDDIGGFVRHYEIAELVRVAAPIYLKFGLRNAPNIYPSGTHLEATAVALTKERLRRARIGLDLLRRLDPDAVMSPLPGVGEGVVGGRRSEVGGRRIAVAGRGTWGVGRGAWGSGRRCRAARRQAQDDRPPRCRQQRTTWPWVRRSRFAVIPRHEGSLHRPCRSGEIPRASG